jgi:hypothetical protein
VGIIQTHLTHNFIYIHYFKYNIQIDIPVVMVTDVGGALLKANLDQKVSFSLSRDVTADTWNKISEWVIEKSNNTLALLLLLLLLLYFYFFFIIIIIIFFFFFFYLISLSLSLSRLRVFAGFEVATMWRRSRSSWKFTRLGPIAWLHLPRIQPARNLIFKN